MSSSCKNIFKVNYSDDRPVLEICSSFNVSLNIYLCKFYTCNIERFEHAFVFCLLDDFDQYNSLLAPR